MTVIRCSKCREDKPTEEFYRQRSRPNGHTAYCRVCKKEHRVENAARFREMGRRSMAKAYAENPEKFRKRNSEEQKRRYARDPSTFVAKGARRRARLAAPHWADPSVIRELYAVARRVTKSTGIKWAVDHIVPLQSELVCGLHCEANLRVIPDSLNKSKSNRSWPGHPDPAYDIEL